MTSEADAKTLKDAIDSGIDPFDLAAQLNEEALQCFKAADKINDLDKKVDAFAICQAIQARANFIIGNADEINTARLAVGGGQRGSQASGGGGGGGAPEPQPDRKPDRKRCRLHRAKTCATPDLCDRYQIAVDKFSKLGAWFGPDSDGASVTADSLRGWWNAHGCVRCFIKAWNKKNKTKDWDATCEAMGAQYQISKPKVVPEIENAIKKWLRKKSRPRFYCVNCAEPLRCGAALMALQGQAGHTAWAYQRPKAWRNESLYDFPEDQSDADSDQSAVWRVGEKVIFFGGREINSVDAQEFYKQNGYTAWKPLWAPDGNFEEAFLVAFKALETPYVFPVYNNCNQATHGVLSAFGANLIPTGDDFWKGAYVPGDYFGFIRVEPQYFTAPAPPKAPTPPRPAPRPILPKAVYQLKSGGALHLERSCPALPIQGRRVKAMPIVAFRGRDAVENEFGEAVCGLCVQRLHSEAHVLHRSDCAGQHITMYPECLLIEQESEFFNQASSVEVPLIDITWSHERFKLPFTVGMPLTIEYSRPSVLGFSATSSIVLKFEIAKIREQFEIELDNAIRAISPSRKKAQRDK